VIKCGVHNVIQRLVGEQVLYRIISTILITMSGYDEPMAARHLATQEMCLVAEK
jgi:hypothetical protein